jgi:hypothetical protein
MLYLFGKADLSARLDSALKVQVGGGQTSMPPPPPTTTTTTMFCPVT